MSDQFVEISLTSFSFYYPERRKIVLAKTNRGDAGDWGFGKWKVWWRLVVYLSFVFVCICLLYLSVFVCSGRAEKQIVATMVIGDLGRVGK